MNDSMPAALLAEAEPFTPLNRDADPQETREWTEAFTALVAAQGPERARYLLDELARLAR